MRELQRRRVVNITARNMLGLFHGLDDSRGGAGPQQLRVVSVLDLTEDVLHQSGIRRGSRVLDLGCGVGDVSLWIAKLVGPTGLVVGVDESAEVIDAAERRATVTDRCYWTRFITADLNTFTSHERFDGVVVRPKLVLHPEHATFSQLSAFIHPGGVIMILAGRPAGSKEAVV